MIGRGMRMTASAGALVMLLSACTHHSADPSAIVANTVSGSVTMLVPGTKSPVALNQGARVPVGSVVHLDGTATLRLVRGPSEIDVLPYNGGADLTIAAIDTIDVSSGFALVRTKPDAPVGIASGGVQAATPDEGTFRFDRELGHQRVGVYSGNVTLSSPAGDQFDLQTLRQGNVAARELPTSADWYKYQTTDRWDTLLLGDIIQIDSEVDTRERGYRSQFGARTKSVNDLKDLAPKGKNVYFAAPFIKTDSGELLVGVVFSLLVEQKGAQQADAVLPQLLTARTAGATWGELARTFGVEDTIVQSILQAIQVRTGQRKPGTALASPSAAPAPSLSGSGGGTPSQSPTPTHSPTPSPSHSPTPSPSPSPTHSPSPSPSPSQSGTPLPTGTPSCLVLC